MADGKSIPIWFNLDEHSRLQEAAALAGYKHISTYIKDRVFNRKAEGLHGRDAADHWADHQELLSKLDSLERDIHFSHAVTAMAFSLLRRKATSGDLGELKAALTDAASIAEVLDRLVPEGASLEAMLRTN